MGRIQINEIYIAGYFFLEKRKGVKLNCLLFYSIVLLMNYMNSQVINETVRLASQVPGIFRKAIKEVQFKGKYCLLIKET